MATPQSDGSIVLTTKVATEGIQKGMSVIKKSIKTATVALTAFGTATAYLVKQSTSAYAEFEQLVGGVETLFKGSSKKLIEYANQAYKTAGVSANEYMSIVTSFSASLLQSLGGDTEAAADIANQALIDMSDNANKMGTSMEAIQNAYQGFAKQNYTMLDNLKLGYGGTKTEMERLLKDAQELTGVKYDIRNLSDVYTAIHVIQENLGIAGTTALEAEKTISGSAATMKAAWQNVLSAISGGGDLDRAIEELVDAIETYFKNILPVVERALLGIGTVIERIAPRLVQTVASAFIKALPQLISAMWQMIQGLFQGVKLALIELLSGKTNEVIDEQAGKTKETAKNQEKLTDNIKKTNKELKKTLAGFDDIQILLSGAVEDTDGGLDGALGGIGGSLSTGTEAEFDGASIVKSVSETFIEIAEKVSGWLMALGCVLLVTGNIGWGIGLIIAGAIGSEYAEAQVGNGSSLKELLDTITNALIIAGVVAIILGILLCMAQMWGLGIKLIAIGAISVGGSVALNWDSIKQKLQGHFGKWLAIGGIVAIVLGVLLCFASLWGLGIGLIALGAAALGVTVVANWDSIRPKIISAFNAIKDWLTKYGGLVLGIILVLTGIGTASGISLIADALGANGDGGKPAIWGGLLESIKQSWEEIKAYWNENIANVWTFDFWFGLAKVMANGFLSGVEAMVNGFITNFESMINYVIDGLNKISFDWPDWVTDALGIEKTFGFNIKHVELGRVSIPDIVTGSQLPTSKAYTEGAWLNSGSKETTTSQVVLSIDGRELGNVIVDLSSQEQRRLGTKLAVAK